MTKRASLAAILLAAAMGVAAGQEVGPPAPPTGDAEQADKAMLYRLTRQVRRVDRDTEKLMDQAMAEAKENGGTASQQTKAKLLSLRDERDRALARLLILSMRYGWEIPAFDEPSVTTSSRQEAETSVFGAIDVLVQRRFAGEARRIAGTARLPVVSLESTSG